MAKTDEREIAIYYSVAFNLNEKETISLFLIIREKFQKPTFIIKVAIKKRVLSIKPN